MHNHMMHMYGDQVREATGATASEVEHERQALTMN